MNVESYEYSYWFDIISSGHRLEFNEAREILNDMKLHEIMHLANQLTGTQVGDTVTYAVSYNINYSNYCAASCPICAFYVPAKIRGKSSKGYELTIDDVKAELAKAKEINPTEIHIVGGFNPYLPLEYYESVFKTVKENLPGVTLKALTIPEIDFIARTTGNSIKEVIDRFHASGMDAHTGGGAEIFDQEVRKQIATPEKISGEDWLKDAKLIHSMGIKGNSTMTYGHVENWDNIIDHLIRLRENEREVPGFLSFIPLKFSIENTPLQKMGKVKFASSGEKDLKVVAMARIIMGQDIKNISVYWVSVGKGIAQMALNGGGSDLVGTAASEKIFGATDRREHTTIEELNNMVESIGKIPARRDTFYNIIGKFDN
ncbi:MAG: radical SAM protein [Candidatus Thermoplasmatota archaeon]|nr:radical SAM protein [Candidatus Thermoplasmatota archaeon]MCL5787020.1 radical SAM protein [Candidatus Thermoplasmatota archaeon]